MTRKELNGYIRYKREIQLLETELEEMKNTDAGLGNDTVFDYRSGYPKPQSVVGFDEKKYENRKKRLDKRVRQIREIEDWIEKIEDTEIRLVFQLRYFENLSWVKIADKTGHSGRSDYVRIVLRDRYLEKNSIK